jgi:hypothetical protein
MPSEKLMDGIKSAVGVHSVYLAAKHDENLAGRFSHTEGKSLVDGPTKATKRSIANVMVYMAGRYSKDLTFEEVEMGLLAAATSVVSDGKRQKSGPNFDVIGAELAGEIEGKLTPDELGAEIKDIIDRFQLYDPASHSYRTVEQGLGVALRMLGWDRRRQMTSGTRAYRWYPPEGFFDASTPNEVSEPVDIAIDASGVDDVFDDWSDDIAEDVVVEEKPKPKKKQSGVKPDDELAARISSMGLYPGISSYEVAMASYDFIGNGIDVPKSEPEMPHKAKLSVGATMKNMGWGKKTRRIDGIPHVGWHPPEGWEEPEQPETVLRKKEEDEPDDVFTEPVADEPASVADGLPRLSGTADEVDDDLPWPDMTDFSGDAGEEGDEEPVEERAYIKEIHKDGREEVYMAEISMGSTGVYLKPTEAYPSERMLEWDADEEIWFCGTVIGGEE